MSDSVFSLLYRQMSNGASPAEHTPPPPSMPVSAGPRRYKLLRRRPSSGDADDLVSEDGVDGAGSDVDEPVSVVNEGNITPPSTRAICDGSATSPETHSNETAVESAGKVYFPPASADRLRPPTARGALFAEWAAPSRTAIGKAVRATVSNDHDELWSKWSKFDHFTPPCFLSRYDIDGQLRKW